MKRSYPKKIAIFMAFTGIAALFTGCGSAPPGGVGAPTNSNGYGPGGYAPGGCVPISQSGIGFSASALYIDSINVVAGNVPSIDTLNLGAYAGKTFGQVTVGSGGAGGPYQAPNNRLTISPDGSISMNIINNGITNTNPNGYPGYSGLGTYLPATGIIQLSAMKIQQTISAYTALMSTYSMGNYPNIGSPGYNPTSMNPYGTYGSTPCVSSVAISLSHYNYNLYGGRVYLYLNMPSMPNNTSYTSAISPMGSGHGIYMQF